MEDSYAAVALYAGLNGLILFALALNAGSRRGGQNALEPGAMGDAKLTRAIRAHGNFAEYAPFVLGLLLALAACGTAALSIHILGGVFTLGRVAHAFGMMQMKHPNALRFVGSASTGLVLLGGGALCIVRFAEALS